MKGSWIFTSLRMLLLVVLVIGVSSLGTGAGCTDKNTGKEVTGDGGDGGSGGKKVGEACSNNKECEAGLYCGTDGKCVKPECLEDKDCPSGKKCIKEVCLAVGDKCQSNGDCPPGEDCVAVGGEKRCKKAVEDPKVAKVEIITPPGALRQEETRQFEAVAYNKSGARLPGPHTFTWASSAADVVKMDNTGLATGGSKEGDAEITAELEGIKSAPVKIHNFAKVEAGKVRVIVLDSKGKAVPGAKVKVADKEADTDSFGAATLDGNKPVDVHVFHKDYSYFSAYGVDRTDLYVQLAKPPDTNNAGGFKGKFDYKQLKDLLKLKDWDERGIGFGFAGASIPGNLIDLNFTAIIGEMFKVSLFGKDVSLPSGLAVDFGGVKPEFQAQGEPGKRILWGLGGKFKLAELQPLIDMFTAGTENIDVAKVMEQALPLLKNLAFAFKPEVEIKTYPKVEDKEDKNGNGKKDDMIPDFSLFPEHNMTLNVPMDQKMSLSVSNIPTAKHEGKDLNLYVISLAGVMVPGAGLVPLGVMISSSKGGSANMEVKYAAQQGALRSGKFAVVTLVLNFPLGDNPPPTFISGNVQQFKTPQSSVSASKFVSFPMKAKMEPEKRKITSDAAQNATLFQVDISSKAGKRWIVVYGPATTEITLPAVPSGMPDPIGTDSSASLRPIALKGGQTMDSVLEFNNLNMDRLTDVIEGFANVTIYEEPKKP